MNQEAIETTEQISVRRDVYDPFELKQTGNSAVATKVQRIFDTDELVTCKAFVFEEEGTWRATFVLDSNAAGDSTYHAQQERDTLRAQTFENGQAAMDAAVDAVESGFEALASAREDDGD